MTAPELIQTIEAAGGVLTLKGDRIRYELPEDAAAMVERLRQYRDEVFGRTSRTRAAAGRKEPSRPVCSRIGENDTERTPADA